MTEIGKHAQGLLGFPTPNAASGTDSYLLFLFPDEEWSQYILGAVKPLIFGYSWYKAGDLDVDDAAAAFREIIDQAPYNVLPANMPTPWWDDDTGDDADDEAPREMQPWYGGIVILDDNLTFVENAFIWAVAGIIAYSGAVGAALSFVPIARRFVVTVKSNPLGGIIRFFADAVEIGSVDTYSPTDMATEVALAMPESMAFMAEDAPTFWAVLADENPHGLESVSMTVMRSRLSENDFSPVSLRYNEGTDTVQYSPDGGETWVDSPADDPRIGTKFIKPVKTGMDVRCRSALSMRKWLRDFMDYEISLITAGAEITAIANFALSFLDIIAPYAVIMQAIIGLAGSLFGAGAALLTASFTDMEWDALLCIFYCDISSDGTVTESQFTQVQTDITSDLNTTAALILNLILQTQGIVGFQNAGTLYEVEDEDCSACECEWCYEWDFTTNDGGWTPQVISGLNFAVYSSGNGWGARIQDDGCSNHAYWYLELALGGAFTSLLSIEVDFASAIGSFDGRSMYQFLSGSVVDTSFFDDSSAITHTATLSSTSTDALRININNCGQTQLYIQKARIRGLGDMPAFSGGSICP